MITIEITEEVLTSGDMAHTLRHIAKLIDDGYTSGYGPNWSIIGEDELGEDNN